MIIIKLFVIFLIILCVFGILMPLASIVLVPALNLKEKKIQKFYNCLRSWESNTILGYSNYTYNFNYNSITFWFTSIIVFVSVISVPIFISTVTVCILISFGTICTFVFFALKLEKISFRFRLIFDTKFSLKIKWLLLLPGKTR